MESRHQTLAIIYSLVKEDAYPLTCLINQREILVRQMIGWDVIQQHLRQLADDELIVIRQLDTCTISITQKGIEALGIQSAAMNEAV